jgi:hypothetical protein
MACGDIASWRALTDDVESLVDRHGSIEHFLVQRDFVLLQPQRVGIAEFSIPGASWKGKRSGNTGFADIVSFASSEIWEIKPKSGGDKPAVDKATHYVNHAKTKCSTEWKLGKSYSTSAGDGVVWRYTEGGITAQLIAEQGQPGAVLYYWKINGNEKQLDVFYRLAIYKIIVDAYFLRPQPLPGAASAPNDLPPGKWKPPVLRPDSVTPAFIRIANASRFGPAIMHMVQTSYNPRILDGSAVAVALDLEIYNLIVGPGLVEQRTRLLQVQTDPTVNLYRQTLFALTAVGAGSTGLVGAAIGGGWAIGELFALGSTAIVAIFRFVAGAIQVARAIEAAGSAGALINTLRASLSASAMARVFVPTGASMLAFVIPSASNAAPSTPVSLRVSIPLVKVLTPYEAQRTNLGDPIEVDGKEGITIALLGTGPD